MKKNFIIILTTIAMLQGRGQEQQAIDYINRNAVVLDQGNLDQEFEKITSFDGVRLFGVGETTHHGKEFYQMKFELFKYLVEKKGIRIFMMEESFTGAYDINKYLQGKDANARDLVGNLQFGMLRNEEILSLVNWIRNFNDTNVNDKIKFYGIDCQLGEGLSEVVLQLSQKNGIRLDEVSKRNLDSLSRLRSREGEKDLEKMHLRDLKTVEEQIVSGFKAAIQYDARDYQQVLHALDMLSQYIKFICSPSPQERDFYMANNVKWIMDEFEVKSKGFIWAHNLHIAKKQETTIMGQYLYNHYKTGYYALGFDYATGILYSLDYQNRRSSTFNLTAPQSDTYAATFQKAVAAEFFLDVKTALKDKDMKKFLSSKKRMLLLGADGYLTRYAQGRKQDIAEAYDGLIFIRQITYPLYLNDKLPEFLQIKN